MFRPATLAAAAAFFAAPALADGHIAEGEKLVAKRCKACHMIVNGDETILKGGKTGPNLWGVVGRTAGTEPEFSRYGDSLVAAGEAELVWDEVQLKAYLEDPKKYLQAYLEDNKAKSKMAFKLKKEEDRDAVVAYLATLVD